MSYDIEYIGKVAHNIAKRYFKESLEAVSIWGQILHPDEFNEALDTINVMVVLNRMIEDRLIVQSSLQFDLQTVLEKRTCVDIVHIDDFHDGYLEGIADYVLAVQNAFFALSSKAIDELKNMQYKCSTRAINFSLERAFVAYGMALNDAMHGQLDMLLEDAYNCLRYSSIALIQNTYNHVPCSWKEIHDHIREIKIVGINDIFTRVYESIKLAIAKAGSLSEILPKTRSPSETFQNILSDDDFYSCIIYTYEFMRKVWSCVRGKEIMTLDEFMSMLDHEMREEGIVGIEIWRVDPRPLVKIKKIGVIENIEL